MLRLLLLLTLYFYDATSNPASCTEDSQCSSGFYCEESAHYCRECLRCADLKREAPAPPAACVTSVLQCGDCFKGLVANVLKGSDNSRSAECVSSSEDFGAPHAYLPAYAWAAIGVALLLMIITLSVFIKTKTFKVTAFSSRTSVRTSDVSGACQPLAPPPYNCLVPSSASLRTTLPNAPEIQCLVDSPQVCRKTSASGPQERPREAAASQAARVYSPPAYGSGPQNPTSFRPNTLEGLVPSNEGVERTLAVSPSASLVAEETTRNNSLKMDDSFNLKDATSRDRESSAYQEQDTNNNRSSPEDSPSREWQGEEGGPREAYVIGGPSFVINVVDSINSLRQRNEAHFYRTSST